MTRPWTLDFPFAGVSAIEQLSYQAPHWNHLTHRLIAGGRISVGKSTTNTSIHSHCLGKPSMPVDKKQSAGPARHPVMAFIQDSVCAPIKKQAQQGAAFIENNVVTPIKKQAQEGVHDAGERFYDAERYKANLRNKSAAELQDKKRRIETTITEDYTRASTGTAAAVARVHFLPHSSNSYTTIPRSVSTTVRSGCNVTKKASRLLHVREELADRGESTSWWAWKETPSAVWRGTTGGTTLFKAGVHEVMPEILPFPEGAFYVNDPYPDQVLQARNEFIQYGDGLADAYENIRKFYEVRATASC
jgi:hypothetical protein